MKKKQRHRLPTPVRILICLLCAGILFFAGLLANICIREGKVLKQVTSAEDFDAMIVLGAQVKPDGELSVQLSWRLDAAAEAYRQKQVPIVVCGARGKNEPVAEAEAMKKYLTENGIPEEDILTDPDSFNTKQNLTNAKILLLKWPQIRNVLIVTSDYHVPRALAIAGDLGFNAQGLGSPCKPEYWIKNHARECLAWVKYWCEKYLHMPLE